MRRPAARVAAASSYASRSPSSARHTSSSPLRAGRCGSLTPHFPGGPVGARASPPTASTASRGEMIRSAARVAAASSYASRSPSSARHSARRACLWRVARFSAAAAAGGASTLTRAVHALSPAALVAPSSPFRPLDDTTTPTIRKTSLFYLIIRVLAVISSLYLSSRTPSSVDNTVHPLGVSILPSDLRSLAVLSDGELDPSVSSIYVKCPLLAPRM